MIHIFFRELNDRVGGEVDFRTNTILINSKISSPEKEFMIERELARLEFRKYVKKNTKDYKKYTNEVFRSIPFSDDLERGKQDLRADYIDEYYAQSREVKLRLICGDLQEDEIEFPVYRAISNLKILRKIKSRRKMKKRYTSMEWQKFNIGMQERLTDRYEIILTEYLARKRIKFRKFNIKFEQGLKCLDRGLKGLDRGLKGFQEMMDEFNKGMKSQFGEDTDHSVLFSKNKSKISIMGNNNHSALFSKNKRKTPLEKNNNYSALFSKNKSKISFT